MIRVKNNSLKDKNNTLQQRNKNKDEISKIFDFGEKSKNREFF